MLLREAGEFLQRVGPQGVPPGLIEPLRAELVKVYEALGRAAEAERWRARD